MFEGFSGRDASCVCFILVLVRRCFPDWFCSASIHVSFYRRPHLTDHRWTEQLFKIISASVWSEFAQLIHRAGSVLELRGKHSQLLGRWGGTAAFYRERRGPIKPFFSLLKRLIEILTQLYVQKKQVSVFFYIICNIYYFYLSKLFRKPIMSQISRRLPLKAMNQKLQTFTFYIKSSLCVTNSLIVA